MKREPKKNIDWSDEKQMNSFKILVRAFYDHQRERISLDNRLGRTKKGNMKKRVPERDEAFLVYLLSKRDEVVAMEDELFKEISSYVHTHPIWIAFLQHVKGCGETMAGVIISEIDIHKAAAVSNLWSHAGLAPGKDRMKKGDKRHYSAFLKAKLHGVLGSEFLQNKTEPYSMFYYNQKTRLENSEREVAEIKEKGGQSKMVMWKDATLLHRHNASIRKMIKEFLKHLYVEWRELERLPVRCAYEEEYLK